MEADFTQYYGASLQQLWDPSSKLDLRWVIAHALQLPEYSRTMMDGREIALTQDQHLMLDILDALNMLIYLNQVAVASNLSRGDYTKVMSSAPKPIARKKEKPAFVRGRDLAQVLGGQFSNIKTS